MKTNLILATGIMLLVIAGVGLNIRQKLKVDNKRLPQIVADSKGFTKWNTNLKNKGQNIEVQDFKLVETSEVFNTKWTSVSSIREPAGKALFEKTLAENKDLKKVAFSPNKQQFVDYRTENRGTYLVGQVRFYGLRDSDKVVDSKALGCYTRANCYFDRGYFVNDDVFVVDEISLDAPKNSDSACPMTSDCDYTFKLHLIDVKNNKHYLYVSTPRNFNLTTLIPEL